MFIILDTVAVYTGALKEMIETNTLLSSKGIILNSINKYKFKRSEFLIHFLSLSHIFGIKERFPSQIPGEPRKKITFLENHGITK